MLLPGVSFAEKTGTFTNTERRVQMVRKAIEPPGEAREDWRIIAELAKRILAEGKRQVDRAERMPVGIMPIRPRIMDEIAALTPSYAGVTHERLERGERLQWPVPDATHPGTPILHVGQFTRGKGKFMPVEHVPPAELPDDEYPMLLSTGRVLYHWHGGEMTRRRRGLMEVYGQALVEVNPDDAARLGLNGNKRVRVTSRRGSIEAEGLGHRPRAAGHGVCQLPLPGRSEANEPDHRRARSGSQDPGIQDLRRESGAGEIGNGNGRTVSAPPTCGSRLKSLSNGCRILLAFMASWERRRVAGSLSKNPR